MKFIILLSILVSSTSYAQKHETLLELIQKGSAKFSLSTDCRDKLKKLTASDFYLKDVEDLGVIAVDRLFSNQIYYHYTTHPEVKKLVDEKNLKSILDHSKTHQGTESNVAGPGFYMATGPNSTNDYGNIKIKIVVKDETRIIPLRHFDELTSLSEQKSQQLGLGSCTFKTVRNIIAESSNVDAVEYYRSGPGSKWLVMLNEEKMEKIQAKYR